MSSFIILNLLSFLIFLSLLIFHEKISHKIKLIDYPDNNRKKHKKPTPVSGGLIVFFSSIPLIIYYFNKQQKTVNPIKTYQEEIAEVFKNSKNNKDINFDDLLDNSYLYQWLILQNSDQKYNFINNFVSRNYCNIFYEISEYFTVFNFIY